MDKRSPFGMIDQFLHPLRFDADCETLTPLGVEPQTLLELGLVVVDEFGDVMFEHDDEIIGGLREELPLEQPEARQPKQSIPDVLPPVLHAVPEPDIAMQLRQCQGIW